MKTERQDARRARTSKLLLLAMAVALSGGWSSRAAAPENDEFASATAITALPYSTSLDTTEATVNFETDIYWCFYPAGSVWYDITLDQLTEVHLDTAGSSYPAGILVFTGSPPYEWQPIGCVSNYWDLQPAALDFVAKPGVTYHVMVGSDFFPPGTLNLSVTESPLPVIAPVTGSPFAFPDVTGGTYTLCPSPDGERLFSPSLFTNPGEITVIGHDASGGLVKDGAFPTSVPWPAAAVTSPAGDRLYVVHHDAGHDGDVPNSEAWVTAHAVGTGPDGGATFTELSARSLGAASTGRSSGIVYVPNAGGGSTDVVYANAIGVPNHVDALPVLPGGGLGDGASVPTGGDAPRSWISAATLAVTGNHLFAVNPGIFDGSNNIAAFTIQSGGGLSAVAGSPFDAGPTPLTGPIALSPDGSTLYAATQSESIVRFEVNDGVLSGAMEFPFGSGQYQVIALVHHPTEPYLVATVRRMSNEVDHIAVLDTRTMEHASGSPYPPAGTIAYVNGLAFNPTGTRLYTGHPSFERYVSSYSWRPPHIVVSDIEVFAAACEPATLTVRVFDPGNNPVTVTALLDGEVLFTQTVPSGTELPLTLSLPVGSHSVEVRADNGVTEVSRLVSFLVTDTAAPSITASVATRVLWPVDYKMKDVGLRVSLTDCDPPSTRVQGLPANGVLNSTQDMGAYRLGPFLGRNSAQFRQWEPETHTTRIDVPDAAYDRFGFIIASGIGDAALDVTFHYTDGTSQTVSWGIYSPDWYNLGTGVPTIISGMDFVSMDNGWWRLYDEDFPALFEAVVENPNPAGIVAAVELSTVYYANPWDPTYVNLLAMNARPTGGAPATVDLTASFTTDVIFAGGNPTTDLDGLFNAWGANLLAGDIYLNLTTRITVYGNEDDTEPAGGGFWVPDASGIGAGQTLRLRAERKPNGAGRIYLIVIRAQDSSGNASLACRTVLVPLKNTAPSIQALQATADAAAEECLANGGSLPAGYYVIGDGPVIGPKQ